MSNISLVSFAKTAVLITCAVFFLAVKPLYAQQPAFDLAPGEWYEVPNSALRSVMLSPTPSGYGDPGSVMTAWSGGAYDTTRDRLIVWGGGHNNYAGNELYAFDLKSLSWSRLTDPSSLSGFSEGSSTMPDGRPKSVHTYDHVQFDPVSGKFFAASGSTWNKGSVTHTTWFFDFNRNAWERQENMPGEVYDLVHLSMASDYDPVSKRIIMLGAQASGDFNPATGKWRKHGSKNFPWGPLGHTAAVDPKQRKFVSIGRDSSFIFDVDSSGTLTNRKSLNASGAREIEKFDAPGLVYDPVIGKLVAWGSGSTVYSLDVASRTWAAHPAANNVSPGSPYGGNYNGTFGRFRYIPSRNMYIVVTSIDRNVFLYRLSEATKGPAPSTAPLSPSELTVTE